MRVYYIGNGYNGCYQVRCLLPLYHNGWDGERTSLRAKLASPEQMFKGAMNADVIVLQRPDDPMKIKAIPLLKKAGKKIVFDNDDTYKPNTGVPTAMQTLSQLQTLEQMNNNLMEACKQADLVTTTTEFLANEYREFNKNVVVLPNMVDPDDFDEPLRNEGEKVRIGLVGSVLANDDYEPIKDVLLKLNEDKRVQLVVFGLPPKAPNTVLVQQAYKKEMDFWLNLNIEWQPFVAMSEYYETLNNLKLDLMLIPRQESYFNKCKSNIKFLEASMLEIPVIASDYPDSPYTLTIKDGFTGYLRKNNEDWMPIIETLINDKELRRQIGRNAKEFVEENFNIQTKYKLWEEAYKTLF